MGSRPFFSGGKLVQRDYISKHKLTQMQIATNWTKVRSSNIRAICWVPKVAGQERTGLGVWFLGGKKGPEKIYWYPSAPFEEFGNMLAAKSKGAYLNEEIVPNYPHEGPFPTG